MKRLLTRAILCALGLAAFVSAQEAPKPCPPIDPAAAGVWPALPSDKLVREGGLRVFRDPSTGEIRQPTREEAAAIAAAEAAPERQPVFEIVVHPDGMQSVDLREALLASVVISRGPDSSVTVRCLPPGARPTAAPAPAPPQALPALEEK